MGAKIINRVIGCSNLIKDYEGSVIRKIRNSLLFPPALDHDEHRIDQDLHVDTQRHVFNINDVIFKALHHLVDILRVSIFDLPPGCNTGTDLVEVFVMGSFQHDLVDEELSFRPWSHNAHFSYQYIVELGDLIEADLSEKAAEGRDPWIQFA